MKRLLIALFFSSVAAATSQTINNMVVFCNDGEPFTLILNGERINMEPQTRVRVEGLPLKKYQTKVIFKNPKLKEANTIITFFNTCYECDFGVNKVGKKKYKIQYFTDKRIEGCLSSDKPNNTNTNQNPDNSTGNNNTNNNVTEEPGPVKTITPTNTILTGPGISNEGPNIYIPGKKCDTPMSNSQFSSFKNSIQKLSSDDEKQLKAWAMMEAACITVVQLKQLLNVFLSDNSKYEFAKKVYERTKDNSEFIKLKEVFVDAVVKDKFDKFLQGKKK